MLAWTEQLYMGEPLIDSQHMELIDFANAFFMAVSGRKGSDEINQAMGFLTDHCLKHFADEEVLMREHKFPGLEAHINEHIKITSDVNTYMDQLALKGASQSFAEDMSEWLEECITHHLFHVDKHFRDYMKTQGQPAGAESQPL